MKKSLLMIVSCPRWKKFVDPGKINVIIHAKKKYNTFIPVKKGTY